MAIARSKGKQKVAAPAPAELLDPNVAIDSELIERRRRVRTIPVPEAVERNDEESWSTWSELSAEQDKAAESALAVAKLRQMLRSKAQGRDPS
jgi:hypothetical protein